MEKCRGSGISIGCSKKFRLSLVFLCLLGLNLLPVTESYARSYGFIAAKQVPLATSTTVFYDGSLTGLPATQGFNYLTNPIFSASAVQTYTNGVTTLDTTPVESDSAGYFAKGVPALDRTAGFSVRFTVQILSETHVNSDKNGDGIGDRAGFSLIILSNDSKGVELGFWKDQIWAQNDGTAGALFTHGEGAAFDTTAGLISYDLSLIDNNYYLSSNSRLILTGSVKDYTAFGGFPYTSANFFFLGDDTSSAKGKFNFSYAAIGPVTTFFVNLPNDTGNVNTAGSLSWALTKAQADSGNIINFAPNLATVTRQPGSSPLPPLKSGVSVQGSCSAPVTLDGGELSGDGLTLQGNNKLTGLTVTHFGGRQIVAAGGSKNNTFTCVVAKR